MLFHINQSKLIFDDFTNFRFYFDRVSISVMQTHKVYASTPVVSSRFVILMFPVSDFVDESFFFIILKISAQTKATGASKAICKIVEVIIVNKSKPENMNENNQLSLTGSNFIFDSHMTMI